MFVADTEPPVARKLLEGWKEELWIRTKVIERARETALVRRGTSVDPAFAGLSLLLTRNLKHVVADIEFIEEFSDAYEQWASGNRPAGDRRGKRTASPPPMGLRSAPKPPERR